MKNLNNKYSSPYKGIDEQQIKIYEWSYKEHINLYYWVNVDDEYERIATDKHFKVFKDNENYGDILYDDKESLIKYTIRNNKINLIKRHLDAVIEDDLPDDVLNSMISLIQKSTESTV